VATHPDRHGTQSEKAVDSFDLTVSSVDSRLGVTARRLHDLEIFDGEVPEVHRVDAWPRRSTPAERTGADGPVDEASRPSRANVYVVSATQRARSAVPLDMRSLVPTVPGVPWWGALAIAAGTTFVGVLIDSARGNELTTAFTVFYVLGCVAAAVAVRYRGLFSAMVQPPLLLLAAVPVGQEFVSSGSTTGWKDLALNVAYPLVNRFPAMLLATLLVLAVGGFRIFVTRNNVAVRARAPRNRAAQPAAARRPARFAGEARSRGADPAAAASPVDARGRGRSRNGAPEKASVRDVTDTRARRRSRSDRMHEDPALAARPRRAEQDRAPRPTEPAAYRAAEPAQQYRGEPRQAPVRPVDYRPADYPPVDERRQPVRRPAVPEAEVTAVVPTQDYPAPRVRYRDRYED